MVCCLFIKGTGVAFCWIPSHCGLTFSEWSDRAAKRGAINNMQSVVLGVSFSSKQMCNIIESYVETIRIQSICHFSLSPVFNNVRRTVSSLVYSLFLSDVKTTFKKNHNNHILYNCHLMESCLLPNCRTYKRHLHLSLQNMLFEHNL